MDTVIELDDRIDIFFGAASESMCRVYARLSPSGSPSLGQLSGTLAGPECAYAETLPATFTFADRGPGGPPLAEAVVPEPCYWTPAMPQLYRADLRWTGRSGDSAQLSRTVGLRRFGTAGQRLRFDGNAWVLRGARADQPSVEQLPAWHDAEMAMYVHQPGDALCQAASRVGVLIVVDLEQASVSEIRRLSRWPAVGMVCLPAGAQVDMALIGHNLLMAERFANQTPVVPSSWADVALCEVSADGTLPPGIAESGLPVIAAHRAELLEAGELRSACDRLQRDLAPQGQFAGYIV